MRELLGFVGGFVFFVFVFFEFSFLSFQKTTTTITNKSQTRAAGGKRRGRERLKEGKKEGR